MLSSRVFSLFRFFTILISDYGQSPLYLASPFEGKLRLRTKSAFLGFPFEGKLSAPRLTDEV